MNSKAKKYIFLLGIPLGLLLLSQIVFQIEKEPLIRSALIIAGFISLPILANYINADKKEFIIAFVVFDLINEFLFFAEDVLLPNAVYSLEEWLSTYKTIEWISGRIFFTAIYFLILFLVFVFLKKKKSVS
ncbi:MAG: hypothetical protein ABIA76_00915 [Candidatus Diapherotrites archaeon]